MAQGRVVVLGSINIDVRMDVAAFPRPGETVPASAVEKGLGGKGANQAVAASRADARTVLIGMVGNDPFPLRMLRDLAPSLDISGIGNTQNEATGTAFVIVDASGQNEIIVTSGANELTAVHGDLGLTASDLCLSQLEVPVAAIRSFFEEARRVGARTILNFAPATETGGMLLPLADIVILNEVELASIAGLDVLNLRDMAGLVEAGRGAIADTDQMMIATLGAAGAVLIDRADHEHIPTRSVSPVDTTGAGDCFCGVFCAALSEELHPRDAIARANIAASLQIERRGAAAAMPSAQEIRSEETKDSKAGLALHL